MNKKLLHHYYYYYEKGVKFILGMVAGTSILILFLIFFFLFREGAGIFTYINNQGTHCLTGLTAGRVRRLAIRQKNSELTHELQTWHCIRH